MKQEILHFFKTLDAAQEKTLAVLQSKQSSLVKPEPETLRLLSIEENEALSLLQQSLGEREVILTSAMKLLLLRRFFVTRYMSVLTVRRRRSCGGGWGLVRVVG